MEIHHTTHPSRFHARRVGLTARLSAIGALVTVTALAAMTFLATTPAGAAPAGLRSADRLVALAGSSLAITPTTRVPVQLAVVGALATLALGLILVGAIAFNSRRREAH